MKLDPELLSFECERLRLLAETNKFLEDVEMSGGWYCKTHQVTFDNQNYCELCKQESLKQEQKTMTREEAYQKLANVNRNGDIVVALEALGLLKFDEVKKDDKEILIGKKFVMLSDIIKALNEAGYRIYKGGYGREL